ncbi:MAG: UDP-N-acetylmuramoyl-L-alanine--D-glutamate ligase, partial [Halofilum sp. (in: g-proteobacteria)]
RDAPLLATALEGAAPIERAGDLDTAVTRAAELAHRGDAVLLSPACASFDMFRDYHERGDVFAAAVRKRGAA